MEQTSKPVNIFSTCSARNTRAHSAELCVINHQNTMFSIAPYMVELLDEHKRPVDLSSFFSSNNLRDVLLQYYSAHKNSHIVLQSKKTFMISPTFQGHANTIAGTYKTGEFGFASEIYSTGKRKIAHRKSQDEAEMLPFFFSFYFVKHQSSGQRGRAILLLSRFKTMGVRSITLPHLATHIANKFPGFTFRASRALPRGMIEAIVKQGTLQKIRFIKRKLPKDLADSFSVRDNENIQDMEIVIKSKRNSSLKDVNWVMDLVNQRRPIADVVTLADGPPDNIKLEMEINGRSRVIDLGKAGKLSSNIDVTAKMSLETTGFPTPQSWFLAADEVARDLAASWGMGKQDWSTTI